MRLHRPSIQRLLLHFQIDNLVFRHEIGMNWKGKLNRNSPVLQAHFIMLLTFVATAAAGAASGPKGLMYASGLLLVSAAAFGYFVGFMAGYKSIWRERTSGTLEQICLSLLPDQKFFEGKFYGALTPFLEARRYLFVHLIVWAGTTGWFERDAVNVGIDLVCGATLLVHFHYSCSIGIMAGLRTAQLCNKSMVTAMFAEREYVFLIAEIVTLVKAAARFAFLFLPICLLLIFVRMMWGAALSEKDLWVVVVPFFIFPMKLLQKMMDLEATYRDRLAKRFKAKIVFE